MKILLILAGTGAVISIFVLILFLAIWIRVKEKKRAKEKKSETKKRSWNWLWVTGTIVALLSGGWLIANRISFDETVPKKVQSRHLSGIFKLPADGRIISRDVNGQELRYCQGERACFQQLGSPGKFVVINQKIPSLTINRPIYTTGRAISSKKIELMTAGGKEIMIRVRIIPYRS